VKMTLHTRPSIISYPSYNPNRDGIVSHIPHCSLKAFLIKQAEVKSILLQMAFYASLAAKILRVPHGNSKSARYRSSYSRHTMFLSLSCPGVNENSRCSVPGEGLQTNKE